MFPFFSSQFLLLILKNILLLYFIVFLRFIWNLLCSWFN